MRSKGHTKEGMLNYVTRNGDKLYRSHSELDT